MNEAETVMQWAGCVTGIAGTLLLAMRNRYSGYGFVVYLISNACWFAFGIATGAPGLAVQYAAFTVTALFGVWRWLLQPKLARMRETAAAHEAT